MTNEARVVEVARSPAANQRLSPSWKEILDEVSTHTGVSRRQIEGRRRSKNVALARHLCMYLARELTSLTLEEIGVWLGGRDHTTICYGVERVTNDLKHRVQPTTSLISACLGNLRRGRSDPTEWVLEVSDPGSSPPGIRLTYTRPDGTRWSWIGIMSPAGE